MSDAAPVERLEITLKNPNPIFEKWVERWLQEAVRRNAKRQHSLREALRSLRSYPLPLATGRDCGILRGFGTSLCKLIDQELQFMQRVQPETVALSTPKAHQAAVKEVMLSVQKAKRNRKAATTTKPAAAAAVKPPKPPKLTKAQQKALADEEERKRQVAMSPGSFRIKLLVDTQETAGSKRHRSLDSTKSYLESLDVEYEVRRLTVGDFLWIACDEQGNELVLPYVIERKRMDDFASSIRDGRFHEQKFRLSNSKIQHIIYLIEDFGDNVEISLPLETLLQASVNTQVQHDILVKHVENHWRAMVYLKTITSTLIKHFKDKLLISADKENLQPCKPTDEIIGLMKFRQLYEESARNAELKVGEVFVQQLLQLHSLSFQRALAIVERYPTPRLLLDAYEECTSVQEARMLLAKIRYGKLERPMGERISKTMYDFYSIEF